MAVNGHLNVVMLGHEKSGKSTTAGHLIYKCGGLVEGAIGRYAEEANKKGEPSMKYAWVLDNMQKTNHISRHNFTTLGYEVTIFDAPGDLNDLIAAAQNADAAVVVVSANDHKSMAQTKEQIVLANAMGVQQLIVAVNKMDTASYSEARFNEIKKDMEPILRQMGYGPEAVPFLPISGYEGDNLWGPELSRNMSWYKGWATKKRNGKTANGKNLTDAIDATILSQRYDGTENLRLPIQDVYTIEGFGTVPVGRVETGVVRAGEEVCFAPSGIRATVTEILKVQRTCGDLVSFTNHKQGKPGDNVVLKLDNQKHAKEIQRGFVAGHLHGDKPEKVESFLGQVVVPHEFQGKIGIGYEATVFCHTASVVCTFQDVKPTDRRGRPLNDGRNQLKKGDAGLVKLVPVPKEGMCVEEREYLPLARIAVRKGDETVAVGVIKLVH